MSTQTRRIFIGAFLVLAGGLFLLQQIFNIPLGDLFIAFLFAAGGAAFLYVVLSDHQKWWASIPGFTLLGLGVLIATSELFPLFASRFGGSIFLGFIALSFLMVLYLNPVHWWPAIPAGVLATIAVVAGLRGNSAVPPAVFFFGTGATFALISLLPVGKKEKWVWIPAGILMGLGILILVLSGALVNSIAGWVFALGFIGLGAYLVIRAAGKKE